MRLVGGIARGVHAWFSAKRIHLKTGIVRDHDLPGNIAAVGLRFFASIRFEGRSIFDDWRKG
jgi:hypothetical protein